MRISGESVYQVEVRAHEKAWGFLHLEAGTRFPSLHKEAQQYLQLMHWAFLLYSGRYLLN